MHLFFVFFKSFFEPGDRPQKALTSKFFAAPVLALAATVSVSLVSALTSEYTRGVVVRFADRPTTTAVLLLCSLSDSYICTTVWPTIRGLRRAQAASVEVWCCFLAPRAQAKRPNAMYLVRATRRRDPIRVVWVAGLEASGVEWRTCLVFRSI